MNIRKMTLSIILLATTTFASANVAKVVYGDDNRKDLFEVTNTMHSEVALSTAAQIYDNKIKATDGGFKIVGSTLAESGVCSDQKFANQVTGANCSGFLVREDLLVTAGHCMKSSRNCRNAKWVFDYAVTQQGQTEHIIDPSSVYSCVEIVEQSLNRSTQDDYALIRLDRSVTDRRPLTFRRRGKISNNEEIFVVGHPTGLPTKVADDAFVRVNHKEKYFSTNLDTFGGNSGSAVFNATTGDVEGILVRGETDYTYKSGLGCKVPKFCSMTGCRGEDVTRITNIKKLQR